MTEGVGEHKPGPNEGNPRPAHEISFDKVMKLPSNAILDGIYAGSIRDPDAVRAYFIRRRTEFLEAHPDREDELDKPGELGRWHGLVYSETAAEYGGLADFCESEVRRRTAGLSGQELDRPTHRQGVTKLQAHGGAMASAGCTRKRERARKPTAASAAEPPGNHA